MTCAIIQPSYIPWRGFFHQIQKSDVFIFYDDVQYDKHGWRNRNRLKFPTGVQWLTIPVNAKGNVTEHIAINQVRVLWDRPWHRNHRQTIYFGYSKAPYYRKYAPLLDQFYCQKPEFLADFTVDTTITLARELGIEKTRFLRSSTLSATGAKSDRLLEIMVPLGVTHYISGPAARAYLELDKFAAAGITVEFMQYDYPEYQQLYGTFDPQVSILDLLMMTGPDAPRYIWDR
jgi:hypothetical protein